MLATDLDFVDFSAPDGGRAALTWGQLNIWRPLLAMPELSHARNLRHSLILPPGISITEAKEALRTLIERHQTLRTYFRDGQPPQQVVERSGRYSLKVLSVPEGKSKEEADRSATSMVQEPFDGEGAWPARLALVREGDRAMAVAIAISHVAADGFALGLLSDDLTRILERRSLRDGASWSPLEQAEYEGSDQGRRKNENSLGFWERQLRTVAPTRASGSHRTEHIALPIRRWRLESRAIAWAVRKLAEQTKTSTSTVLLAAYALVHQAVSDGDAVAIKLIAGNRYLPKRKTLVSSLVQDGMFVHRADGGDFSTSIKAVHERSILAYFNAMYSRDALDELVRGIGRQRAVGVDITDFFNDARRGEEWACDDLGAAEARQLPRLLESSRLLEEPPMQDHDMSSFFLAVRAQKQAVVTLLADTRRLPKDRCERILPAIEKVLCEAVLREVDVGEVRSLIGG